jgi:formate dehydrogenase subunit gamma
MKADLAAARAVTQAPPGETEARFAALCADVAGQPGALLVVLRRVQEAHGYVPERFVPVIARALNLSRAEVHGVITFYHELRDHPPGRHTVRICQAEACQSMGAAALTRHAVERAGAALKASSADGRLTVEPVYCLGNCACSPAIMIDRTLHGRVTPARFDALIGTLE